MPGPFSMSGSSVIMDESSGENGWARERSAEFVVDNGRTNGKVEVDAQLWHACAGAIVHLPQVGTKVVYFPQGHAEHAASLPEFPRSIALTSTLLCRVLSVNFLADTETDEVYARIRLQPDPNSGHDLSDGAPPLHPLPEKSASFVKTLTQSDANNGGGFSVPRYCAETIFPRLDYKEDPPVQIVRAKDVHGTVWKFRHIYRGTPRRHLLTTGWSNFVNHKKLVAGDAIVFLRSATGELCVGVRRSTRGICGGDASSWHLSASSVPGAPPRPSSRWKLKPPDNSFDFLGGVATVSSGGADRAIVTTSDMGGTANFARNRARITARDILEAASLAAAGQPFEVVYYPRAAISEFCVKAHAVKAALQQNWVPGMRFKMAVETEDASRVSWFMGTISKVQEADPIGWPKSPWKMLQVTWDEPDLLHGIVRVSPWQVELVSPMQLPLFSLPKKKVRLSQSPELQLDGQGLMGLSRGAPLVASNLGYINPWHGFADNVTARMQGARHDRSAILDFQPSDSQSSLSLESFYKRQEHHVVSGARVSTDLNMSNFGNEGHLREHNHLSTLPTGGSSSSEPALSSNGDRGGSSISKSTPFLLFGKAIDMSQSAKSQPPELSGGSSSADGQGLETLSDGNQSEALDKMHMFLSGKGNRSIPFGQPILLPQQGEALDSAFNEVGTLNWFKEWANVLDREKAITTMDNHCNVFIESDEVSRTVDLSMFDSYEELHEKLSLMFGIQKTEMLNRIVCVDSMGCARPIADEPYRDFTKRVKRLKILSESSSESITR